MLLSEWMQLPIKQREAHIDLSTPCELRRRRPYNGFPGNTPKKPHKSEQIEFHGLIDDIASWKGVVYRCHLCEHGSQNGYCSNPRHIRLGTCAENEGDKTPEQKAAFSAAGQRARKGRPNKPGAGGNKTMAKRVISTIDGYLGSPASVGAHHRPYKLGKGERVIYLPPAEYDAFETLTPLQRMMAIEMM
jgi:hypothetical protein